MVSTLRGGRSALGTLRHRPGDRCYWVLRALQSQSVELTGGYGSDLSKWAVSTRAHHLYPALCCGCIVVKVALATIRSSRDQRGIQQEWGRVTQENFRPLYTEAQVRLDPYNQNANAQSQILGDLMRWYFPTTANAQVETSWGATLGWQRADETSPWEPTVEVRGKQRVTGTLPPDDGSTVAVYRSLA